MATTKTVDSCMADAIHIRRSRYDVARRRGARTDGVEHPAVAREVQPLLIEGGRPEVAEELARAAHVPPGFDCGFMAALLLHAQGTAQLA